MPTCVWAGAALLCATPTLAAGVLMQASQFWKTHQKFHRIGIDKLMSMCELSCMLASLLQPGGLRGELLRSISASCHRCSVKVANS